MIKHVVHICLFFICPVLTQAHEIRPGYLEIKENADHSMQVTWKQPLMGEYGVPINPSISAGWLVDSLAQMSYTETYLIKHWKIPATHQPLDGQSIRIDGLEKTMTDVLLRVTLLKNVSFTYLIKPVQPFVKLILSKPPSPPVWQYSQLGLFHIWTGYDHLLFVLGLLLLVKKRSRLVWTITAFTIAHSITLALATLQIVNISSAFTEAAIAMSIAFLAVELVNHHKGKNGFTYQHPWIVSFLFGLLHGLGFAGALRDVGLPDNHIPFALFLFNVGVEAGQLVFVFIMLVAVVATNKIPFKKQPWQKYLVPYFIGTMATFWTIERICSIGL
jgi:hydrogenase/urease accessory protein HupE